MKSALAFVTTFAMLVALALPASAHVGSPNVFYEGDAGPYHLFVTVRVPQVIPGVAEVEVRTNSDDVSEITTAVARLSGAGSKYVPVPDLAKRSKTDPRFFSSSLWLMEYGSLRVVLNVKGTLGAAELSVPVASFGQAVLPMPKALGALLLLLAIGLALGAIFDRGSGRARITHCSRRGGFSRLSPPWLARDGDHDGAGRPGILGRLRMVECRCKRLCDPREIFQIAQVRGNSHRRPVVDSANRRNLVKTRKRRGSGARPRPHHASLPVADAGLRSDLASAPGPHRHRHLRKRSPSIDAGHYQVFADIVDKYGFPWTLVGAIDLPNVAGPAMTGDDSKGIAPTLTPTSDTTTSLLPDGTQVIWKRAAGPLKANVPMILEFEVEDKSGAPANDLEPYMGMAAHAEIIRDDLSVFAHIHPSGSASMASMMMASADNPGSSSMADMKMPTEKIAPELSMPYGFPKPGLYRIFLQFKRAGRIETAYFDAHVQ